MSHWVGGTASLNWEGVILTHNETSCGIAAENSSAFLWTGTVGAVRAAVKGKASWEQELCRVTALTGRRREGTLVPPALLQLGGEGIVHL